MKLTFFPKSDAARKYALAELIKHTRCAHDSARLASTRALKSLQMLQNQDHHGFFAERFDSFARDLCNARSEQTNLQLWLLPLEKAVVHRGENCRKDLEQLSAELYLREWQQWCSLNEAVLSPAGLELEATTLAREELDKCVSAVPNRNFFDSLPDPPAPRGS